MESLMEYAVLNRGDKFDSDWSVIVWDYEDMSWKIYIYHAGTESVARKTADALNVTQKVENERLRKLDDINNG